MCPTSQAPSVCVTLDDDTVVLTLSGELDLTSRRVLETVCREAVVAARRHLLVDMEGVSFIDCGSLSILRSTLQHAEPRFGAVPVVAGERLVLRVMELTGFSRAHVVVPSLRQARQILQQSPPAQRD